MCALFTTTLSTYAYTVTYYGGNCNPNQQTNYFDTTYSVTDSNHPATGDDYQILMDPETSPLDDIFQDLLNMTFPTDTYTFDSSCYTFLGWLDENNHNYNYSIHVGDPAPAINPYGSTDTNLYAKCHWFPTEVGYYPGTCNGSAHREYMGIYGTSFNMPSASAQGITPPNNEYTFRGWSLDPSATTVDYNVGDSYTLDVCVYTNEKYEYPYYRFYAVCTLNEYNINYYHIEDSDTWTGNHPTTYTYSTTTNIGTPSRTNYVFLGWCIGSDGCNNYANYQNGYTISGTTTGDVNLYAQWDCAEGYTMVDGQCKRQYTITYDANAQSGATVTNMPTNNPENVIFGNSYHLASTPKSFGYSFKGWYCPHLNANNNLSAGASGTYNYAGNETCTAQWQANTIYLKWNPKGGLPNTINSPDSCVYGRQAGIPGGINNIVQPTRYGYDFVGWILTDWQCDTSGLTPANNGTRRGYINENYGASMSPEDYGLTEANTWGVTFSWGKVTGIAKCSTTNGTVAEPGKPEDTYGNHCWCQITTYTPKDGEQCKLKYFPLVYEHEYNYCGHDCADFCGLMVKQNLSFRTAVFTQSE
jgi:uncharacterized repeat protein (TIGR02543 family)